MSTYDDYREAVSHYETEKTGYNKSMEELKRKAETGKIVKVLDITSSNPKLCYREVGNDDKKDGSVNPINKLKAQDKRNQEISVEKTVEDVKKHLKENTIPDSEIQDFENDMLYYIMLSHIRSENKKVLDLKQYDHIDDAKKQS